MSEERAEETMKWSWMKCRYDGDQAKYVQALANDGFAYHVLEAGKDAGANYVIAAFKFMHNSPTPLHLAALSDYELKKVKEMEDRRNG